MVADIAHIDARVDELRAASQARERSMFGPGTGAESRKAHVAAIALLDDLVEELLARRALLLGLLASPSDDERG